MSSIISHAVSIVLEGETNIVPRRRSEGDPEIFRSRNQLIAVTSKLIVPRSFSAENTTTHDLYFESVTSKNIAIPTKINRAQRGAFLFFLPFARPFSSLPKRGIKGASRSRENPQMRVLKSRDH